MSLGQYRGAVLIGRPLDIAVPVVLDLKEDLAALCLEANVFYADNQLSQSRIQVTSNRPSPAGQNAVIRIRSSVPIDEPVVTVALRSGCQQKTERRYVMLADLASEAPSMPLIGSPVTPTASNAITTPSVQARGNPAGEPISAATIAATSVQTPGLTPQRRSRTNSTDAAVRGGATAFATADKRSNQRAKNAQTTQKGGARLSLRAVNAGIEGDPQLRASGELLSVPSASPQERFAFAALWRALMAQPQDIARDAERLQTLESTVLGLQMQGQKKTLAFENMDGQIKQAQAERYANPLVYGLGALLLLALAALGFVTRRWMVSNNTNDLDLPWWRRSEPRVDEWASKTQEAEVFLFPDAAPAKAAKADTSARGTGKRELDLDLGAHNSDFIEVKHLTGLGSTDLILPLPRADRTDFGISMNHPERALKAEELFDVQQQADFFISLGQHEQAIEVLRSHISDNVQTSPLVYLDLFNIYHQLKLKPGYEALRDDFNRRFNAEIPEFELYSDVSAGLEAHQTALSRIELLWPSSKVLDVIEESLFRQPGSKSDTFNLEAYRELLLLYCVAREIISPESTVANAKSTFDLPEILDVSDAKTTKFGPTSIQPLSTSVVYERPPVREYKPSAASVSPLSSSRPKLDLDLSDFGSLSESSAPEIEPDSDFFAQFSVGDRADVQAPDNTPVARRATAAGDNSVEFESFDVPLADNSKSKLPKSK